MPMSCSLSVPCVYRAFLTHSGDSGGVYYPVTDSGQENGPHEKSGGFAPPLFLCLFAVVCPAGNDFCASRARMRAFAYSFAPFRACVCVEGAGTVPVKSACNGSAKAFLGLLQSGSISGFPGREQKRTACAVLSVCSYFSPPLSGIPKARCSSRQFVSR